MTNSLIMPENELISTLSNSLYVGASAESIKMVLGYCQAAGLDPMLKPVHIVPMYCSTGKKTKDGKDIKAMRDIVMPGIGLYRIQASRTGQLAGTSEPEFGEEITEKIGAIDVTYPKYCKITIKRLMTNNVLAEFTAKEFWKENYATKSRDDRTPNTMWQKRPFGQIAKCAEAQALRKAFHELGSQPTADEMEGKDFIDINSVDSEAMPENQFALLPDYPDLQFQDNFNKWSELINKGKQTAGSLINMISTKYTLTEEQIQKIKGIENARTDNA